MNRYPFIVLILLHFCLPNIAQNITNDDMPPRGKLLYSNSFSSDHGMDGWRIEGPGKVEFRDGWMIDRKTGQYLAEAKSA